ncbi:putative alpha-1,6-mannanase (GH76 family) [Paenibacillus phyllosphaerae]|uniref:Putative alpha-1,6-mannanase (GH76 family) n=1 Tax=Paenibacillus phyllosphaerae TaxID=274593 RepID=A0A7W5B3W4_9BACL|nr:glycoside hydrolase family 76 protein [Paenibacillus phyllosphaerae]MBB3113929.1 putative alpha-1,6-mannanase (GH76 family) [Paenibacillus phyllosphaerae]
MVWTARAEAAQQALEQLYWNPSINLYDIEIPCPDGACNTIFHYWWMAHAVDALVDGLERTGHAAYKERLAAIHDGLLARNGGAFPNELYDDMEWMAIAWLRAYQATGEERYKDAALVLWEDIQTGWNDHMGGGIAWQKSQLDYKNTPANAPAVILAARLFREFGRDEDLAWALRIYAWQKSNLVDPETGFVWDGMNRTGDGSIDKDWKFTYCQGVFIGAGVELFRCTGNASYLADAVRTAGAARDELVGAVTGVLPDEGDGDGGLFKGILVRYLGELTAVAPEEQTVAQLLEQQADTLWTEGRDERNVFSTSWGSKPADRVTLSTQLSGIMLLEQLALLEKRGLLAAAPSEVHPG